MWGGSEFSSGIVGRTGEDSIYRAVTPPYFMIRVREGRVSVAAEYRISLLEIRHARNELWLLPLYYLLSQHPCLQAVRTGSNRRHLDTLWLGQLA